jgi:hypothetical protein
MKAETADAVSADVSAADAKSQLASAPQQDLYSDGRTQLIKTVDYRFEVENVKKTTEAIEQAIKKYPAYISSSDLLLDNPILENKITIRVRHEYFQDLLRDIDQQALFVNFRNVKTDDKSKEFVDLESRLRTKREVEQRYADILRSKTGTIEELLQAEKSIGELHEEIEATVSRINYLREQVTYSTINLEYYQRISEVTASNDISVGDDFKEALSTGWKGIVVVLLGLAYIWPILVIAACVVGGIKFYRRRQRMAIPLNK